MRSYAAFYGTDIRKKAQPNRRFYGCLRDNLQEIGTRVRHTGHMSESYELFQQTTCPFCGMVSRFLDAKGIDVPRRDTMRDPDANAELVAGGGRPTVPCLKITSENGDVRWMYESMDIMRYLDEKFAA